MDLNEHDEEPQHEPGTSSSSQTTVPVLPYSHGPAASSQGPATSSQKQLQVLILVMKTVSIAMRTVYRVKNLDEQYSLQISTF